MAKITYTTKIDNQTSALPAVNKVAAADMNEIKTSVNSLYDSKGGWVDYEDSATSGTPINLTQNVWTDLTNNKSGSGTVTTYKPSFVTGDLWNSSTNSLVFTELGSGKIMIVRNDFDITAGAANTRLDARLYFPDTNKTVEFDPIVLVEPSNCAPFFNPGDNPQTPQTPDMSKFDTFGPSNPEVKESLKKSLKKNILTILGKGKT